MTAEPNTKVREFMTQVQAKIQTLLTDFAKGNISREQFHVIYGKYDTQLAMAEYALRGADASEVMDIVQGGPPTIRLREAYTAKVLGIVIYSNRVGTLIETLGDFDVSVTRIATVLNNFTQMMQTKQLIERQVNKINHGQWLVFMPGVFTTVVVQFQNEPSEQQLRYLERLHHDFEEANRGYLQSAQVDSSKLAYPFLVFVQKKTRR